MMIDLPLPLRPPKKPQQQYHKFKTKITIPNAVNLNDNCKKLSKIFAQYIHNPKNNYQFLANIFKQFNHSCDIPHTKSNICAAVLNRKETAYRCYECMTEQNSIVCVNCFDLQKHQGHHYELIQVQGGCCDCGDIQKWKKSGTCSKHSHQESLQVRVDQTLMNSFLEQQHYALIVLLQMYAQYIKYQKELDKYYSSSENQTHFQHIAQLKYKAKELIVKLIELYSKQLTDCLIQFNQAGKYALAMSEILLKSKVVMQPHLAQIYRKDRYFQLLFQFQLIDIVAQHFVNVMISVFPLPFFRKEVTIMFIQKYNRNTQFAVSGYGQLSSQLLTSHITISQLVRQDKIEPLIFHPVLTKQKLLLNQAQQFCRYYYDVAYLSRLYGNAALQYFSYHAKKQCFKDFGYYRILLNDHPESIDLYGLENIYIQKMENVVRVIMRDQTKNIMKIAIKELYHFITSFQTKKTNFFRPQQRLFALIMLVYLDGDLQKLNEQSIIQQLLIILQVNNFPKQLSTILTNLCVIFNHLSKVLQNGAELSRFYTFFSMYIKKSDILFNLDCFLLKICLKLADYHNNLHPKSIFEYEKILQGEYNQSFDILSKFNKLPIINEDVQQNCQQFYLISDDLKNTITYIGILTQALYSDVPQLSIICSLQAKNKAQVINRQTPSLKYDKLAFHYYEKIIKSNGRMKIPIKQTKLISQCFFKQEQVFRQIAHRAIDRQDHHRLNAQMIECQQMNIDYFKSTVVRLGDIKFTGKLNQIPYLKRYHFKRIIKMDFIRYCQKGILMIKQLGILPNLKISPQMMYYPLLAQMWRVSFLIQDQQLRQFVCGLLRDQKIAKELNSLRGQIQQYLLKQGKQSPKKRQEEQDKVASKRQKLLAKKGKLMKQINKGAQYYLQNSYKQKEVADVCSICQDPQKQQDLSLISFLSFTNYHGWYDLKKDQLFPVISTCGHYAHRSCYKQHLAKNRVYSNCYLCKQPTNITVPLVNSRQNVHIFFKDHVQVLLTVQEGAQTSTNQIVSDLFNSFALEICLRSVCFATQSQKQMKCLKSRYQILKRSLDQLSNITIQHILLQQNANPEASKIVQCSKKVLIQTILNTKIEKQQNQTDIKFQIFLKSILSQFQKQINTNKQNTIIWPNEVIHLKSTISFSRLPQTLQELASKYRGKCPNCQIITHQLSICLICGFITCINCHTTNLMTHAKTYHQGHTIFVKASSGQVIYIYRNRFWAFQSLYQDYMQRSFEQNLMIPNSSSRQQYKLVPRKYQMALQDIKKHKIQIRLRYQQKMQNRVNNDEI